MRTSAKRFLPVLLVLSMPLCLRAQPGHPARGEGADTQDNVSADRPGMSTGTDIVPRLRFQVETGFSLLKDHDTRTWGWNNTLLRFGVLPWMELRAESNLVQEELRLNGLRQENVFGLEPFVVGTKIRIWEGEGLLPAVGLLLNVSLPLSSQAFRPDYPAPGLTFLAEQNITDKLCIGWNLGCIYDGHVSDPVGYAALCVSYGFTGRFGAFAETNNYFQKGASPQYLIEYGLTWHPGKNVQLDLYSDLNAGAFRQYFSIGAGLTWLIR